MELKFYLPSWLKVKQNHLTEIVLVLGLGESFHKDLKGRVEPVLQDHVRRARFGSVSNIVLNKVIWKGECQLPSFQVGTE